MTYIDKLSLKGKNVWITGAKRIGKSVALALAELGANIVVSYRTSKAEAEEVIDLLKPTGAKVLAVQCDVTDIESVKAAVKSIKQEFGTLDIMILMASIFKSVELKKITAKDWQENFSTHVLGSFWAVQASLEILNQPSRIILVSDRTAIGKAYPGYLPYVVTKGAVASMTKALAAELGPKGIYVNALAPGPILKPADISDAEWESIRVGSVVKNKITDQDALDEFVHTVVRLCSVRSTGDVYPVTLGL